MSSSTTNGSMSTSTKIGKFVLLSLMTLGMAGVGILCVNSKQNELQMIGKGMFYSFGATFGAIFTLSSLNEISLIGNGKPLITYETVHT